MRSEGCDHFRHVYYFSCHFSFGHHHLLYKVLYISAAISTLVTLICSARCYIKSAFEELQLFRFDCPKLSRELRNSTASFVIRWTYALLLDLGSF
jgi:hypothetical protein